MGKNWNAWTNTASLGVYITVQRLSDAMMWNGENFEEYDETHWASYCTIGLKRGPTLYHVSSPPGLPEGEQFTYLFSFYIRKGAEPAVTDRNFKRDQIRNFPAGDPPEVRSVTVVQRTPIIEQQ